MSAETGEYKGHPTLTLRDDNQEKRFITFGVSKAKLILEHLGDIQQFVGGSEKPSDESGQPNF